MSSVRVIFRPVHYDAIGHTRPFDTMEVKIEENGGHRSGLPKARTSGGNYVAFAVESLPDGTVHFEAECLDGQRWVIQASSVDAGFRQHADWIMAGRP